ncbi:Eukaryotic translation initiation factor 3 subunit E [Heterocephalus glaber]|uniref:Eukaryotic translation initiation factor 3 subunit E n=1 Tax=Heterocephalus glaber TaxID=10181 RepID=G5BKW3_HETGA|nr:Eukaryotic translation initiation factor 3 subunit E [Heterocephalus glaber]
MQSTRDVRMLFDYLADEHGFRQEYLDTLYRVLVPATDRNALSFLWGKLASEILMQNWDAAMEDLTCLKETIDNNSCISISMLADKLNMTPEEAERWIVNLVRNARLDAKIDSKLGHVVMGNNAVSPYQQVIEKTKSLSFRSQMLAVNTEKKLNQNSRSEAPNWATQDSGFY